MSLSAYLVQKIRYEWSPRTQLIRIPGEIDRQSVYRLSDLALRADKEQAVYVRTKPYSIYIGVRSALLVMCTAEELRHVPEDVNAVSVTYYSNTYISGFVNTWNDLIGYVRPHNFDWVKCESKEISAPYAGNTLATIKFKRIGIEHLV